MLNLDTKSAPVLVLLPGLDGSGELFRDFSAALPFAWDRRVIAYPPDEPWGYDRLVEFVREQLPPGRLLILLGESFSGPVALRLAVEWPDRVVGLILACTFAECPSPLLKLARPWLQPELCRLDLPAVCIRYWLCDPAGMALAREVSRLMRQVAPAVRAARFRALADVDLREHLPRIRCPILCLTAGHDRLIEAQCLPALLSRTACRPRQSAWRGRICCCRPPRRLPPTPSHAGRKPRRCSRTDLAQLSPLSDQWYCRRETAAGWNPSAAGRTRWTCGTAAC